MKTLDRTKPYAETYGGAGHRYEQDGLLFDNQGNEISAKGRRKAESASASHEASGLLDEIGGEA